MPGGLNDHLNNKKGPSGPFKNGQFKWKTDTFKKIFSGRSPIAQSCAKLRGDIAPRKGKSRSRNSTN